MGEFGPQARQAAETFLRRRLVHFIATDAHNTTKRPPRVREAQATLEELVGSNVAEALMVHNPRAVVENKPLPYDPDPLPEAEGGFFTRLRSFFNR
jgi:protein-tyrosine phosphatase